MKPLSPSAAADRATASPGFAYVYENNIDRNGTPPRHQHHQSKQRCIGDPPRKHGGFGGFVGKNRHPIFDNLTTLLDSPTATASATTSSGSGGSPHSIRSGNASPGTQLTPVSGASSSAAGWRSGSGNETDQECDTGGGNIPTDSDYERSPNWSISTGSPCSQHPIDHTALLLGFCRNDDILGLGRFEERSDDEREWNACFSPDASSDKLGDRNVVVAKNYNTGYDDASVESSDGIGDSVGSSDQCEDTQQGTSDYDESSCSNDGLQLDIASASVGEIPVTFNYEMLPDAISNGDFRSDGNGQERGLGETECYGRRKDVNSMGNRRRSAAIRAVAMRERASSALAAKASMAKCKASGAKDMAKERSGAMLRRKSENNAGQQKKPRHQVEKGHRPNGMEITTTKGSEIEVLSHVSEPSILFEAAVHSIHRNDISSSSTPKMQNSHLRLKAKQLSSKVSGWSSKASSQRLRSRTGMKSTGALSQTTSKLSVNVSSMKDNTLSMKEKASSALYQKAYQAKAKTMKMVLTSTSPSVKQQHKTISRTQWGSILAVPLTQSQSPLVSVDDDDGSKAPSMLIPEGPSINTERFIVSPHDASTKTPKVDPGKSYGLQFIDGNIGIAETLRSPISPPPINACPSNTSSMQNNTGSTSAVSCIDEDGFLISPAASTDAMSSTMGEVGTVNMGDGEEPPLDPESPLDPDSFLFLSPMSNVDLDDPDYGMPELLSRSSSLHTATAARSGGGAYPPETTCGKKSKLLTRPPPSPRLPPSGNKMAKKMKGYAARSDSADSAGPSNSRHVTRPRRLFSQLHWPQRTSAEF